MLFGSSNDPRDQLGAILIESGRITREQLDEVNAKVGPGNPLAKVLAESGFVNQRELGEAARMKVERILADVLSWDLGQLRVRGRRAAEGRGRPQAVDREAAARGGPAHHATAPSRCATWSFRTVLEPLPDGESALSEVRADVWPLLERLDGRRTLKDAIALTRLDEFEAVKTACAMLFLGIVQAQGLRRRVGGGPRRGGAERLRGRGPVRCTPCRSRPWRSRTCPPSTGFAFCGLHAGLPGSGAGAGTGARARGRSREPRGRGPPRRAVPRGRAGARAERSHPSSAPRPRCCPARRRSSRWPTT